MRNEKILIMLFLLIGMIVIKGQGEYPVGVYIRTTAAERPNTNYAEIEELGTDWVMEHADNATKGDLENFNVIGMNLDTEADVIMYYSGGYYSKWEAENDTITDLSMPRIKHGSGEADGEYWRSTSQTQVGDTLVYGPHYVQSRKYNLNPVTSEDIDYIVNFKMKMTGDNTTLDPVCRLSVKYTILKQISGNYISLDTTLTDLVLLAKNLSTSDSVISLDYKIPAVINGIKTRMTYPDIDLNKITTDYPSYGVEFIVEILDDTDREIYVDYIEVYDRTIWEAKFRENKNTTIQEIISYASRSEYSNWEGLKYWYAVDEPYSIDQYEPIRIVDSVLSANGFPRLITALYPGWSGKKNWEITTKRFLEITKPERLMLDYYPFYPNKTEAEGLESQRLTLQRQYDELDSQYKPYMNNFYFVAQAHGFWDDDGNPFRRIPTAKELSANVMLALAHGAKGMFFWNYFSYNNGTLPRCSGILDLNGDTTDLYDEIKDHLTPRLKGALGDKLLKLNYTGEYISYRKIEPNIDLKTNNNYFVDIFNEQSLTESYNYHVGLFENVNDADEKCFMVVNLLCDPLEYRKAYFSVETPNYPNIIIRNIGGSYQKTFIGGTTASFNNTIPPGEGYLYQVAPVIRYGGELITDETISTANDTLKGTLRIPTSIELTINKPYVIEKDIFIETEGKLTVGVGGELILDGGKVRGERWEDIFYINQNQTHPKLVWSINREYSNPIRYNIWRKKNTQSYEKIAVINDKNITEYTDTDTEIILGEEQANQTTASYYIQIEEITGRSWTPRKQTITATVSKVEGIPLEKQAEEINLEEMEFNISQNYPNPFNPTTSIKYTVPSNEYVTLKVYDILGNEVATLVNEQKESGNYTVNFDGDKLSSGLYIYKIQAGNFNKVRKMMLIK